MKKKAISFLTVIFIVLLFTSCSSSNSYKTMFDAANAVIESEDIDLLFSSGVYVYSDQDSFDRLLPTYSLTFLELYGDEPLIHIYDVQEDITLANTGPMLISEEAWTHLKENNKSDEILNDLQGNKDLTHAVVDLIQANGRSLDEEIFSSGYLLFGRHDGPWYFIEAALNKSSVGVIQAAYNKNTKELLVANPPVMHEIGISTFRFGGRLLVSKDLITDVVYSSKITADKWDDVIELFPESGVSIDSTQEISNKIEDGYYADYLNSEKESVQIYSMNIESKEYTLYLFEDESWYLIETTKN